MAAAEQAGEEAGEPPAHEAEAAALVSQGATAAEAGDMAAAISLFQRALEIQPSDAATLDMLAQCYLEAGDDEEGYKAAAAAVSAAPGWAEALLSLGRAARNTGRLREAAAAFEACAEAPPERHQQQQQQQEEEEEEEEEGEEEEEEDRTVAQQAQRELLEVQQLLQQQVGHLVGMPGLQIQQQHAAGAGPGAVVWEAGALLAWLLVKQHQQQPEACGNGSLCSERGCSASAGRKHQTAPLHAAPSATAGEAVAGSSSSITTSPLKGARVLEVGSGTGIVGIAAACLGAHVTATDIVAVLPQLTANVQLNAALVAAAGGSVEVAAFEWGGDAATMHALLDSCRPEWLLGADLVYTAPAVTAMAQAVGAAAAHAAAHGRQLRVLIAHKQRHEEVDAALLQQLGSVGVQLRPVLREPGTRCVVFANSAAAAALGL